MWGYVNDDNIFNFGVNCSFKSVVLYAQFLFITTQTHTYFNTQQFWLDRFSQKILFFWLGPSRGINTPCMILLEQDVASLSLSFSHLYKWNITALSVPAAETNSLRGKKLQKSSPDVFGGNIIVLRKKG